MVSIHQATLKDLKALATLFDGYRQFYGQESDVAAARVFLRDRLSHSESVIFMASCESSAVGFTQLYPLFSSISLGRTYLLSDLFVASKARKMGAGRRLLEAAADFGRSVGAHQLMLETARSNLTAQSLYEACGWVRDNEFFVYNITLSTS